jgi:DNA end-binding protein Ku
MHKREHVAIIKPSEDKDVLVLNRIRFPQEIRSTKDLDIPSAKPKPAELKMAVNLIDQLTEAFDPSKYKDDYTAKLMKVIQAKAKGKKLPFKPMKVVHSKTQDLMDQLKASLSSGKRKAS